MPRFDRTLIISAASGLLLAAAFPRPDLYPLAWVALIPLLLVMRQRPFASGFASLKAETRLPISGKRYPAVSFRKLSLICAMVNLNGE